MMFVLYFSWIILIYGVSSEEQIEAQDVKLKKPRLFQLDDYDECFSTPQQVYCVGSFQLYAKGNNSLIKYLQDYSLSNFYHFNRTLLHRGYCLSMRCQKEINEDQEQWFSRCVNQETNTTFNLDAKLIHLDYCKSTETQSRPLDTFDRVFGYICLAILVLNLLGTAYDLMSNQNKRPNKLLISWSIRKSWNRLFATYENGDEKLNALSPLQGMKAITMMLIILAHTMFSSFKGYFFDPDNMEALGKNILCTLFYNGAVIVQTFIMITSFLFAYNLLLYAEKNPSKQVGINLLFKSILNRLARLLPVYVFVLGLVMTWWAHGGDGALWSSVVEREKRTCRNLWWTHLLFFNNLYQTEDKCLMQTWFIAVDMQIFLPIAVLTLLFIRRPRAAIAVFASLFVLSTIGNMFIAYYWDLKSVMYLMKPEDLRSLFKNVPSFNLLYIAPWANFSAALLGTFNAFLFHHIGNKKIRLSDYKIFSSVYYVAFPLMLVWVISGYWLQSITNPIFTSMYAALDKSVFVMLVSVSMLGLFQKIDDLCWRFLSWRVWQVMSRLSLSVLLLHWIFNLTLIAVKTQPTSASILEAGCYYLGVTTLTYLAAIPLSVFVEIPVQKFLLSIIS